MQIYLCIYGIESKCVCAIKKKEGGTPTSWVQKRGQRVGGALGCVGGGEIRCGNTQRRHEQAHTHRYTHTLRSTHTLPPRTFILFFHSVLFWCLARTHSTHGAIGASGACVPICPTPQLPPTPPPLRFFSRRGRQAQGDSRSRKSDTNSWEARSSRGK